VSKAEIVLSAVDKTRAAFDSAKRNMDSLGSRAAALPMRFGTLGTAIAAAFTAITFKGAINTLDQLDDLSEKTGIAVESLSALRYAGEVVGTPLEAIATSSKRLAMNMAEAAGGNKEAIATFKAMHVEIKNADGSLRSQDAVLLDIADRFAGYEDGAAKAALAQRAFGKTGADMIPLLNQGSVGIRALRGEAEAMGAVFGGDLAKQAAAFNDNLKRLELNAEAAKVSILSGLLPALNKLIEGFLRMKREGLLGTIAKDAAKDVFGFGNLSGNPGDDLQRFARERDKLTRARAFAAGKGLPTDGFDSDLAELAKLERVSRVRQEMGAVAGNGDTSDALSRRLQARGGRGAAPVVGGGDKAAEEARRLKQQEAEFRMRWGRADTIRQAEEMFDAWEREEKALKALGETKEKVAAISDKHIGQMVQENEELLRSNMTLGEQIETIGLTAKEVKALTLARMAANLQLEREKLLVAQNVEGNEQEVAQIQRRIQLLEKQRGLTATQFDRQASADFSEDLRTDVRGALQRAFEDSKNPWQAFVDALGSTLYTRISSALTDAILDGMFTKSAAGGGGGGGLGGWVSAAASLFGFDGGGYTGSGPRAGGLDGKGGFLAMMHPQESVFDHFKGRGAAPAANAPNVTIVNQMTVGDVASGQMVQEQLRASEKRTMAAFSRASRYGGAAA
jgi:hypothetical protein